LLRQPRGQTPRRGAHQARRRADARLPASSFA